MERHAQERLKERQAEWGKSHSKTKKENKNE
jgi:hypothetical protein